MKKYICIIFVVLVIACNKFTLDSSYHISCGTKVSEESKDTIATANVLSFAFYIAENDEELFAPSSYEEALSGKISRITNNSDVRSADITGSYNSESGLAILPNLTSKFAVFVLCDTENKIYAFREFEVGEDLPIVTSYILFQPFLFTEEDKGEKVDKGWVFNK